MKIDRTVASNDLTRWWCPSIIGGVVVVVRKVYSAESSEGVGVWLGGDDSGDKGDDDTVGESGMKALAARMSEWGYSAGVIWGGGARTADTE